MSQQVNGKVIAVNSEPKTSKAGNPYTVYRVVMDDGTNFQAGIKPPPFKAGDSINVEVETKYGELQLIKKADDTAGAAAAGSGGTRRASGGKYTPKPFPLPADHGDNSIVRQNSLAHAVKLALGAQDRDALTTEETVDLAIDLAYKFTEFSTGRLDEERRKSAVDGLVDG